MAKAAVLPEPVRDCTRMSRPSRAMRNGRALDFHGLDEAHVRDGLEDFLAKAEIGEGCLGGIVARGLGGADRRGIAGKL
jgi:hypothetical protein